MLNPRVIPCLLLSRGGLVKTTRFGAPKYVGDPINAVRIFNASGEVRCNLQVGGWIRQGTVSLPKGLWRKHTANGYTTTALVPDALTDIGGGACFNDARVQVTKL